MYPILFKVGPVTVYSFGVLMAVGFYVAALMTVNEYRRRGNDGEAMWNLVVWIFVAGLVGSRVFSIFNDVGAFFRDPLHELISGSGFVWYGGLIGGFIAAWFLRRLYKMDFPTILDCTAIGLPIGQAIGRIGCHVAGDGDWGTVTNLPWGVAYKNAIIGWYYQEGVRVHPTPLYEAAAYTLVFLVLLAVRRRNLPTGTLFAIYLIGTSTARFLVEFIRLNPKITGGLTEAQIIALVLFTGAVLWLVKNRGAFRVAREAHS